MRYRAILRNVPGMEKPQQTFANDVGHLTIWAQNTLAAVEEKYWGQAFVDIEEVTFTKVKTVKA